MLFFAAAEGIAVSPPDGGKAGPGQGHEEQQSADRGGDDDYWQCLCPLDRQTVVLGSRRASFCVLDVRLSQGHQVLRAWRSVPGRELLTLQHCRATGNFWALERQAAAGQGGGHVELVRYAGLGDGGRQGQEHGGRVSVDLKASAAAIGVGEMGIVAASLAGGAVELWRFESAPSPPSLQRVGCLQMAPVLGVSTQGVVFDHVALLGASSSVLVVGIATDVWVVHLANDSEHNQQQQQQRQRQQCHGLQEEPTLMGTLDEGEDALDCAVPNHHGSECIKARPGGTTAKALTLSHLTFHRPGYTVSELRRLASGPGWVEFLVVAGRAAYLYRVAHLDDGRSSRARARSVPVGPTLTPVAELGFNTMVLATAMGESPEHPWLFVMTLSGIEIWALPRPRSSSDDDLLPCRLLVQRLEYRQRLDRLPPIGMGVSRNALVLLANPPGLTPAALPDMLFHTVPRPSPERIPELSSRSLMGSGVNGPDGAFGIGYDVLVLHLQPLAAVYRHAHAEARRTLRFARGPGPDDDEDGEEGGDGSGGEGEEDEDRYVMRFVEGELLDSSVYGIQPERVIHRSGTALLATLHALLEACVDGCCQETEEEEAQGDSSTASLPLRDAVEALRREELRELYESLARRCASLLGSVWLEPRARGVRADLARACRWFLRSETAPLTVCSKLLRLRHEPPPSAYAASVERALIDYMKASLGRGQAGLRLDDGREEHQQHQQHGGAAGPRSSTGESAEEEEETRRAGKKGASWAEVVRAAHGIGGEALLSWLVLASHLPWARLPHSRTVASSLLGTEQQPSQRRAEALLALAVHDLAATVEDQGKATVTLDSSLRSVAWLELPDVEGRVGAVTALVARMDDAAVGRACLRAPQAVMKHLVLQEHLPLVVKGPLFPYLEEARPRVLAGILAEMVASPHLSGSEFTFETLQVLRLLGPYGTSLSQEMAKFLAKNEPSPPPPGTMGSTATPPPPLAARRSPSMTDEVEGFTASAASKELVHLFLATRFRPDRPAAESAVTTTPDPLVLRPLLAAELLGLDLDSLELAGQSFPAADEACIASGRLQRGTWALDLAAHLPCGRANAAVQRLAGFLSASLPSLATPAAPADSTGTLSPTDWEWALRWLSPRLSQSSQAASASVVAATRLVKLACLAEAGGGRLVAEAVDALLVLVTEVVRKGEGLGNDEGRLLEVIVSFGQVYFRGDAGALHWRTVLSRMRELDAKGPCPPRPEDAGTDGAVAAMSPLNLHDGLVERLAEVLPVATLVQALPDDADAGKVLDVLQHRLLLVVEGPE